MKHPVRRPVGLIAGLVLFATVAMGCNGTTPSVAPPSPSTAPSTAAPSSAAPSSAASASASPATASPPASAAASPATASPSSAACAVEPTSGLLPSDRMVDVVISGTGTADLVTFVFGDASLPAPPQGASEGFLEPAEPPYTEGASGLPVEVDGEHVMQLRFTGMSLANDVGQPTYDGQMDFRPDLAALRTVVNYDMFEGVVGWYIGYDGPGCVTLASDSRSVTVAIEHPAS